MQCSKHLIRKMITIQDHSIKLKMALRALKRTDLKEKALGNQKNANAAEVATVTVVVVAKKETATEIANATGAIEIAAVATEIESASGNATVIANEVGRGEQVAVEALCGSATLHQDPTRRLATAQGLRRVACLDPKDAM